MHPDPVTLETKHGVAWITINVPEKLNALSFDIISKLDRALDDVDDDPAVRVVVITGAGDKAFVAGADIKEIMALDEAASEQVVRSGHALMNRIENLVKPVIAAINGYALGGGCELALACNLRIASSNAMLGLPEVKLGLLPGYGGTQRLTRTIGSGRALHLMLLGDPISAQQAQDWGLVTLVVEPEDLQATVAKIAAKLARLAPLALSAIKDAVHSGRDLPIASGLDIEAEHFMRLCASEDMREGTSAFLEKRKPEFKGR